MSRRLTRKPGSIDHGTLGLLVGEGSLGSHLVQVVAHVAHLVLAFHLGALDGLVLAPVQVMLSSVHFISTI